MLELQVIAVIIRRVIDFIIHELGYFDSFKFNLLKNKPFLGLIKWTID